MSNYSIYRNLRRLDLVLWFIICWIGYVFPAKAQSIQMPDIKSQAEKDSLYQVYKKQHPPQSVATTTPKSINPVAPNVPLNVGATEQLIERRADGELVLLVAWNSLSSAVQMSNNK